jgi:hypothetical protein
MNQRGWGWTPSEIRQTQLIEWLVEVSAAQPNVYVPVKPFYDSLPGQAIDSGHVARGDLDALARRGLVDPALGIGGIESLDAMPTDAAQAQVERLHAARASRQVRRAACRDAMVDWLYSLDAVSRQAMPARDEMLNDLGRGIWFGQPFCEADLDEAAAWLHRNGLALGLTVDQADGPVRLYLTDRGVECAEDFASDTRSYMEKQRQPPTHGPTVHIQTNSAPFQVAGDHAQQVQNIGARPEDLRLLISGITEIVRTFVPGVAGADEAEQAALTAMSDEAVDQTRLERFRDWALSSLQAGATNAVVAAVSSSTTFLLIEAARLASRLG